jgi:hypothetical protein
VREFLAGRGVDFDSVNVLEGEDGLADLRALGAKSVPVVSRGDQFVFAQSIPDVVSFLGLDDAPRPDLSPRQLVAPPPKDMRTTADLAAYGESVRQGILAWWDARDDQTCGERVPTYYGKQPLHEVLERTTWHPCQHVRQLMALLERLGIAPDQPLTAADLSGLPLPAGVWDA